MVKQFVIAAFALFALVISSDSVARAEHVITGDLLFSLDVTSVKATDELCTDDWLFGCGYPDYYAVATIDTLEYTSSTIDDEDDINPTNWSFPTNDLRICVECSHTVEFTLEIWDDDGGFNVRGSDDQIKIDGNATQVSGSVTIGSNGMFQNYVLDGQEVPLPPISETNGVFTMNDTYSGEATVEVAFVVDSNLLIHEPHLNFGDGSKPSAVAYHSPLLPDPTDTIEIYAAVVDDFGVNVEADDIEIWIDVDASDFTLNDRFKLNGSGTCELVSPSAPAGFCFQSLDLSTIQQPEIHSSDGQWHLSYIAIFRDANDGEISSGWRTTTVGNLAGATEIGFSLSGKPTDEAVDLVFSASSLDFGAAGCGITSGKYQCSTAMNIDAAQLAIWQTWVGSFLNSTSQADADPNLIDNSFSFVERKSDGSLDWVSKTIAHSDLIKERFRLLNFWISTEDANGQGYGDFDGDGNNECSVTAPQSAIANARFVVHSSVFRDCANSSGVTLEVGEYSTTLHELGHRPFGIPDNYCCDGGYSQPSTLPVLWNKQSDCEADSNKGKSGVPAPAALSTCRSIVRSSDSVTFWTTVPRFSMMSNQFSALETASGTWIGNWTNTAIMNGPITVLQATQSFTRPQYSPASAERIQSLFTACSSSGC